MVFIGQKIIISFKFKVGGGARRTIFVIFFKYSILLFLKKFAKISFCKKSDMFKDKPVKICYVMLYVSSKICIKHIKKIAVNYY